MLKEYNQLYNFKVVELLSSLINSLKVGIIYEKKSKSMGYKC